MAMAGTNSAVSMGMGDYKELCKFLDRSKEREALELVRNCVNPRSKPSRGQLHMYLDGDCSFGSQTMLVVSPLVIALRGRSVKVFQYLFTYCPTIVNKLLSTMATYIDFQLLPYPICDKPNRHSLHYCLDAKTLLHLACRLELVEAIQTLLERGANTEIQGCRIGTPMHIAAEHGKVSALKLLLDAGANIEACDVSGNTPLHAAVAWDKLEAVELLLDRGADVTAKSVFGDDMFTIAVRRNTKRVLPFLCDRYISQIFSPSDATLPPSPPPLLLFPVSIWSTVAPWNTALFKELIDHPECPSHLSIDAKLIRALSAWYCLEAFKKYKAVLVEKQTLQSVMPATTSCSSWYGDHYEVGSVEEWEELRPGKTSFFIQSCIVLERCIGSNHPVVYNRLNWFVTYHARNAPDFNPDIYRKLRLKMFVRHEELKLEYLSNAPFNVDQFLRNMAEYSKFDPHIELTRLIVKGFEVFLKVRERHRTCQYFSFNPAGSSDPTIKIIDAILTYLHNLINVCNLHQQEALNTREACVTLTELREIISIFVHLSHTVLKRQSVFHSTWMEKVSRDGKSKDSCIFLLTLLLESDAVSLINMPDPSSRVHPLHYIERMLSKEGVSVLLSHGAHLDVAGRLHPTIFPGKIRAFRLVMGDGSASDSQLTSPLPLLCQCSHIILREKIQYHKLNLPSRVKDFIAMHETL